MFDQSQNLKTRINLSDYDYQKEIDNRLLLGSLNQDEMAILEEITFSPTSFSITTLVKNSGLNKEAVLSTLEKVKPSKLLVVEEEQITVNKDARKYFELHIEKFDEDFSPNLNFLSALIRRVPLDVLPMWYPIPRSSDNIFESLVEKFLLTPQMLIRYMGEVKLSSDLLKVILDALETDSNHFVSFKALEQEHNASKKDLYEASLTLEFLLLASHTFDTTGDEPVEGITFFNEWKDYLNFKDNKKPACICDSDKVPSLHEDPFFFLNTLDAFLALCKQETITLIVDADEAWSLSHDAMTRVLDHFDTFAHETEEQMHYVRDIFTKVVHAARTLKLISIEQSKLDLNEAYSEWQTFDIEEKALFLYRKLVASYDFSELRGSACKERKVHEIEKSLIQIPEQGWILLSEFLSNLTLNLSEQSQCRLTRFGKKWKYVLPSYSNEELSLIEKIVYDWLFQVGAIQRGLLEGKPCIKLTPFGKKVFATR